MFFSLHQCLPASRITFLNHLSPRTRKGRSVHYQCKDWPSTRNRPSQPPFNMPPKRKRSSVAATSTLSTGRPSIHETPMLPPFSSIANNPPSVKRQASRRGKIDTNPDHNADIVDGKAALRASPDVEVVGEAVDMKQVNGGPPKTFAKANGTSGAAQEDDSDTPLSDVEVETLVSASAKTKAPTKSSIAAKESSDEITTLTEQTAKEATDMGVKGEDGDEWDQRVDLDGDDAGPVEDVDIMKREAGRTHPVNSDYLPLPWKGQLGYVSSRLVWPLNTVADVGFRHA